MDNVPRSEQFDDVYFSAQDGLAEARHVFIEGNRLSERWEVGAGDFVIGETGFGTGLNFLAAWNLWRQMNARGTLTFFSFEKFPVTHDFIAENLERWRGGIGEELNVLIEKYPRDLGKPVYEIVVAKDVVLKLIFGDVNDVMPETNMKADAWFLDGFKPSSNPDMWSERVFQNMARMSNTNATLATFTSAGFVRRGLTAAGFEVLKVRGYGRKREMCVGTFR